MRKIVGYTLMGLDGSVDTPSQYFPPSDDPNEPFVFDEESEAFEKAAIETQDAVLLGRNQYEEWRAFWPSVRENPFATFINSVPKYVVTSTPIEDPWDPTEVVQGPLDSVVHQLKAREGRDIGAHGSIHLLRSLIAADLLDELRLNVGPVIGTPGRRLFDSLPHQRRMRLLNCASTSTGNLLVTYGLTS